MKHENHKRKQQSESKHGKKNMKTQENKGIKYQEKLENSRKLQNLEKFY